MIKYKEKLKIELLKNIDERTKTCLNFCEPCSTLLFPKIFLKLETSMPPLINSSVWFSSLSHPAVQANLISCETLSVFFVNECVLSLVNVGENKGKCENGSCQVVNSIAISRTQVLKGYM